MVRLSQADSYSHLTAETNCSILRFSVQLKYSCELSLQWLDGRWLIAATNAREKELHSRVLGTQIIANQKLDFLFTRSKFLNPKILCNLFKGSLNDKHQMFIFFLNLIKLLWVYNTLCTKCIEWKNGIFPSSKVQWMQHKNLRFSCFVLLCFLWSFCPAF